MTTLNTRVVELLSSKGFTCGHFTKRAAISRSTVRLNTSEFGLSMMLFIGKPSAAEQIVIPDMRIFSSFLQKVMKYLMTFGKESRVSHFYNYSGKQQDASFLEILLDSEDGEEAWLSIYLEDWAYNLDIVQDLLKPDSSLSNFFSQPTASFADFEVALEAIRQFSAKGLVQFSFLTSPNYQTFVRAQDESANNAFINFLKVNFEGACTITRAGMLK